MKPIIALLASASFAWSMLLAGCDREDAPESGIREQVVSNAGARPRSATLWPQWPEPVATAHLRPDKPAEGIIVPPGTFIEWEFGQHSEPVRYAMGGMNVVIKGVPSDVPEGEFMPSVAVEAPGRPVRTFADPDANLHFPVRLGFGSLDRDGTPFLLVKSYSGGPHCCTNLIAAVLKSSKIEVVDMGSWDGQPLGNFPSDHDGDGATDFILRDDRFLYALGAYSNSWSPPKIMNIAGARLVDASMRPGFRDLFMKNMREARRRCMDAAEPYPDGFCAGYVASAIRAGQFESAWVDVVERRGPNSKWKLNSDCLRSRTRGSCPLAYQNGASTYLTALRSHLERLGYIS